MSKPAPVTKENRDLERIRARLGHLTLEWAPTEFLDTGIPDLNEVLGHRERGLTFGRILEIFGWESVGKTSLTLTIAALAQKQNASVVWCDLENSFDADWCKKRGLTVEVDSAGRVIGPDSFTLIQPYVGHFGKEKEPRLTNAQELCAEAEMVLGEKAKRFKRLLLVVDSIPAMETAMQAKAGIGGSNMRTKLDLAVFLSELLRHWVGMAQSNNCMIILLNQLRSKPDPYNPDYTPGGNAARFYSHVRAKIRRAKGGVIKGSGKTSGRTVGMKGILENRKNKSGSPEKMNVGFKIYWSGPMQFCAAKDLEKDE